MSLQRYLFILVTLFILLLGLGQLWYFDHLEQQLATEVEQKSLTLSKRILDISSQYTTPSSTNARVNIDIQTTPNKHMDLGNGVVFTTGDKTQTLTISRQSSEATKTAAQVLIRPLQDSRAFTIFHRSGTHFDQQVVQFDQQNSAVAQYFNQLMWATAILCVCGVLFALWLAKHISNPLSRLSSGFQQLEQGNLGSTIPEQGIKEVKNTFARFNRMSKRLLQLNAIEKSYQQREQLAELGEVARGLAHALRNPLNTIGLAAEQLQQQNLPLNEQQQLARQIQHKVKHLDANIKALMNLTTSGIDRHQAIDLISIIEDVRMELSMSYHQQIVVDCPQEVAFFGAANEVRTILHSLITNAVEASPSDRPVKVIANMQDNTLKIDISDQGSGIDTTIKDQLFKPHISTKAEGAGMGLYIAKRMSQLYYQGDVQLQSSPSGGTIASLILRSQTQEQG